MVDYKLQTAPESGMQTIEDIGRISIEDDAARLNKSITFWAETESQRDKAAAKARNVALESEFDREVKQAVDAHNKNPLASSSQLDTEIDSLLWSPKYSSLTMSTKYSILKGNNYDRPLISSVEAGKLVSQEQAKKTAQDENRFANLGRAYLGPEVSSKMTSDALVEFGKEVAAQQQYNDLIPAVQSLKISDEQKKQFLVPSINNISSAIGMELQQKVEELTPEQFDVYKIQKKQQIAAKTGPEVADYIVERAAEPYETIIKDIRQSREDYTKSIKQQHDTLQDIVETGEMATTGMSVRSFQLMQEHYGSYDEKNRERIRNMELQIFNNSEQVRRKVPDGYNTPQDVWDNFDFYFNHPLSTSNQKMNTSAVGMQATVDEYAKANAEGETRGKELEDAYSHNVRALTQMMAEHAPEWSEAFSKYATPEQKAVYQATFNKYLDKAIENEMSKLGREAWGSVQYSRSKHQFVSDRTLDKARIEDLNNLLGNLRQINKSLNNELFSEETLEGLISKWGDENMVYIPRMEGGWEGFKSDMANLLLPIQSAGGALGDTNYDWLVRDPRALALARRNRERANQKTAEDLAKARAERYYGQGAYPEPSQGEKFETWLDKHFGGKYTRSLMAFPPAYALVRGTQAAYNLPGELYNPNSATRQQLRQAGEGLETLGQDIVQTGSEISDEVSLTKRNIQDWWNSSEDTKRRIKNEEGYLSYAEEGNIGYGFNLPEMRKLSPQVKERLEAVAPGITTEAWEKKHELNPAGKPEVLGSDTASKVFDILFNVASEDAITFAGPAWNQLSEARKQALVDMSYNMGGIRLKGFKEMRKALQAGDYNKAADEILKSSYAEQLPNRARRNATLMRRGQF